jgi:hypothetical protein
MIYNKALREVLRGWMFLGISAAVLAFLVIQFELREDDLRLAILEGSFPEAIEQPTEAPTVIEDSVSAAESADGLKVETDSAPPSTDEEPSDASALVPPPTLTRHAGCSMTFQPSWHNASTPTAKENWICARKPPSSPLSRVKSPRFSTTRPWV